MVRSQTLYPAELRARFSKPLYYSDLFSTQQLHRRGFEPHVSQISSCPTAESRIQGQLFRPILPGRPCSREAVSRCSYSYLRFRDPSNSQLRVDCMHWLAARTPGIVRKKGSESPVPFP